MATIFEISTTNENHLINIKKALSHLQTNCEVTDCFFLSKPVSKLGWTFFQLKLKSNFSFNIEKNFSDMIQKYKGKNEEKFTKFMLDFFEARGAKIKLKLIEY